MKSLSLLPVAAATLLAAGVANAAELRSHPKAVLELFTSQGCSSCPQADLRFSELGKRDDLITLAYHVDYWDYIGWADTFGSKDNTDRQKAYAQSWGKSMIYTPELVVKVLEAIGVTVLEQSCCVFDVGDVRVGVAGAKGFGGGMPGVSATAFGEPEMKAFVHHGEQVANGLAQALGALDSDLRLVLLHYSPVLETLEGEPPEIHAFLGDYRLAEAVDQHGADLVVHGHAHVGRERGRTPGGVPVRNVAKPVIRAPFRVFELPVHDRQLRVTQAG